jgi:hypothetical protein
VNIGSTSAVVVVASHSWWHRATNRETDYASSFNSLARFASSLGATFILNATSMRLVFVYMDGWLGLTGKLTPIVRSAPAQPTLTDEPLGGGMSLKNIAHSANFSSS